jgi:hypothetical protein
MATYSTVLSSSWRSMKNALSTTPATARPHVTPNRLQPQPPRRVTSVTGVYVPAINR